MLDTITSRGIVSIIGGFLVALVIGTSYLWGIISLYITSYFRIAEGNLNLTQESTALVFPFMFFGMATMMPIGVKIMKKQNARICCMLSGTLVSTLFYISSYCQTFNSFALIFGVGGGLVIGFLYMIPVAHCYKYFPKKKGTVSGIIVAGSGIGTFLFGLLASQLINPNNLVLTSEYYAADIAMNVPSFLRQLAIICLCATNIGALGLLQLLPGMDPYAEAHKHDEPKRKSIVELMETQFMIPQDDEDEKDKNPFGHSGMEMGVINSYQGADQIYGQNSQTGYWSWQNNNYQGYGSKQYGYVPPDKYSKQKAPAKAIEAKPSGHDAHKPANLNECPRVRDAPTVKIFWIFFICMLLGSNFGLLISGSYKSYGKKYIHDDKYLSLIGAIGSMGNGVSRIFWATMLDKFDFKCLYTALLILNGFLAMTVNYAVQIPQVYMLYVFLAYVCYGGHLGMFPAVTSQVFGIRNGTQIYGLLFQAYATSNLIQFFMLKTIKVQYGYQPIFWLEVIFNGLAMFIARSIEFSFDWSEKIRENNDRKKLAAR